MSAHEVTVKESLVPLLEKLAVGTDPRWSEKWMKAVQDEAVLCLEAAYEEGHRAGWDDGYGDAVADGRSAEDLAASLRAFFVDRLPLWNVGYPRLQAGSGSGDVALMRQEVTEFLDDLRARLNEHS